MVVAKATRPDGGRSVLLGLTAANIELLKAGRPIVVSNDTHAQGLFPDNMSVTIVFGASEQAIADALVQAGSISDRTKIRELHGPDHAAKPNPCPACGGALRFDPRPRGEFAGGWKCAACGWEAPLV